GHGVRGFRHGGREPGVYDGCVNIQRRFKYRRIPNVYSESEKDTEESDGNFFGGGGRDGGEGGGATLIRGDAEMGETFARVTAPSTNFHLEEHNQQQQLLHNEQEQGQQSQADYEEKL
ncbi:unnamed protein product, partial [Allacma fusca]